MKKYTLILFTFVASLSADIDHEVVISQLSSLFYPNCWESKINSYSEEGYFHSELNTLESAPFVALIECETWDSRYTYASENCEEYIQDILEDITFVTGCNFLLRGQVLENFNYSYLYQDENSALVHFSGAFTYDDMHFGTETFVFVRIKDQIGEIIYLDFDEIPAEKCKEICRPEFYDQCEQALLQLSDY